MRKKHYIGLLLGAAIFLFGCSKSDDAAIEPSNYAVATNWLAVPTGIEHEVDLFYLYPSCWTRNDSSEPIVNKIDNPVMRSRAPGLIETQASAYAPYTNVFAPFYRQYDPRYLLTMPVEEHFKLFGKEDRTDALAAFDYYIKNYNNGRPFILAGHSQGAATMLYVLSDYMKEHPDVYRRMVAAYIVGFSVWVDYLAANPHLKFAERADDTGVIISYHTEAPVYGLPHPLLMQGSIAINPLSWRRDDAHAGTELNLGTMIKGTDGVFKDSTGFADAQINLARGTVICSTADTLRFNGYPMFPYGCFHTEDYSFYYYNLRANGQQRVNAFLNN